MVWGLPLSFGKHVYYLFVLSATVVVSWSWFGGEWFVSELKVMVL
jgi:hypothetical protein